MAVVKRIVCLANSRKRAERCVAGKELRGGKPGAWLRPVSARSSGELTPAERSYAGGGEPRVLDVLDAPLRAACAKDYQQENWLIEPGTPWRRVDRLGWSDLHGLVDPVATLWFGGDRTFNGRNDMIALSSAVTLKSSSRLVHLTELVLCPLTPGGQFADGRRRLQGRFYHAEAEYWLWVTDPVYERRYLDKPDGQYRIGDCFVTISLSEPFNGACYKVIAAIIQPEDAP